MDLTRTRDRDPHIPLIPNPAQLAAYRRLLRFLFADGDATPPPEPPRPIPPTPDPLPPAAVAADCEAA